jgi:hypothetical protein
MADNVFRVSVANVKTAYENLPPPLRTGGEDDESLAQLGQCKNWPLLWPKNLLHVEAAGSTPTTTKPIQGMTTTPPTQLPPPSVMLGESARCEQGGPIIAPMEEDMDDDMDEDDPLRYINTGYDDTEMMSQPPYDSGYEREDEMHVAQEPEHPQVECKKSLFMQSSQDTPPDAASIQGQLPEGRAVLSPTTLGAGVWKGLEGSVAQPKKK